MKTKKPTKVCFQISFELTDLKELQKTYPNFRYNYSSFEDWVKSNIDYMKSSIEDIGGYKLEIRMM